MLYGYSFLTSFPTFSFILVLLAISTGANGKKTTTTTLSAQPATSTTPSYADDDIFRSDVLSAHNAYRTSHNASTLTWNSSLADSAALHAQPCLFVHTQGGSNGENLAAGYPNATAAVDGWAQEEKDYSFDDPGFDEKTGHFTQVIWKATKTLGCGASWCAGEEGTPGWFVVCQYSPPGNVEGTYEANVQKPVKDNGTENAGKGSAALRADGRLCWLIAVTFVVLWQRGNSA
ncbi:MAG: hypothetical protein Q9219_007589 [cf. Caloplaca sp. 3 TL-2023]